MVHRTPGSAPTPRDQPEHASVHGESSPPVGRLHYTDRAAVEGAKGYIKGIRREAAGELEPRIEAIRQALAEQYKKFGATPEDFSPVSFERDGKTVRVVAYTGVNGLDLGYAKQDHDSSRSWDSIMARTPQNDSLHTIEIDGIAYDARQGMTTAAYKAIVQVAKEGGRALPDSEDGKLDTGERTWTWLTGAGREIVEDEGLRGPLAAIVYGSAMWLEQDTDRNDRAIRFRPAVEETVLR